ncbi:MAG: tail fiber protein [Acidovorax sp.]|jgi:microcystin-dependent protein|nr:tail fiber protein [Acidovorax sp.]
MSDAFLGEIRLLASAIVPSGWAVCDGRQLAVADNTALFALLGNAYGGDGSQTFALPDLRGRLPIGIGQGPGLSPRNLGDALGEERVTLAVQEMPPHTHALQAGGAATSNVPRALVPAAVEGFNLYATAVANPQALATGTVQATQGSEPHNNVMPSLVLNFIMCLDGASPNLQ